MAEVYAFVVEHLAWWREAQAYPYIAYGVSVKGDEMFERHRRAFVDTGLIERHRTKGVGKAWTTELRRLAEWLDKSV